MLCRYDLKPALNCLTRPNYPGGLVRYWDVVCRNGTEAALTTGAARPRSEGSRIRSALPRTKYCLHSAFRSNRTACLPRLPQACGDDRTTCRLNRRGAIFGRRGCGKPKTVAPNVRSRKMQWPARPMRCPSDSAPPLPLIANYQPPSQLPLDHYLVDVPAFDLRLPLGGPNRFEADAFVKCQSGDVISSDKGKEFLVAFVLGC